MKKILVGMLVLVLAACAPDREEEAVTETPDGEAPEKPDTLHVWIHEEDDHIAAMEEIFAAYTEETGIEIEYAQMSAIDQSENIALDGPAGTGPDIYHIAHNGIGSQAAQNLAAPIELDAEQEARFTEESIEGLTYEGQLYGIPFVSETTALLVNENIVNELPTTVDELENIAESETNVSNDEYGFLADTTEMYFAYPFLTGFGGYIFSDDGDIGLNNEGTVRGAELLQSWHSNNWIPTSIDGEIQDGLFIEGNVGVSLTGPWNIPSYARGIGEENLRSAPLPELPNGEIASSFVTFKSWVLSPFSDEDYWAQDLMHFITNDTNNMEYYRETNELPAVTHLLEDPEITDDPLIQGFAEQIQHGTAMPNTPEADQVWYPINDALQFIAEGQDIQEVLDEAVERIEENIEMMGG
ncbi:extracellular solute-binding protein [Geomicrobium sp. JSM 1781026]|uniref:sugar ABC transporter substrate-binding protein n=1 Tax=Geomicrobium sp. JSM 1781026 TaxID=3344580 RepID=UPI0035C0FC80